MDGKGEYIWSNGDRYNGEFRNDMRNGKGEMYKSNQTYTGQWKDNKRCEKEEKISLEGDKYVGDFKDDKFHGKGVMTWINGNRYNGEFKNNWRHGKG